MACPMRTFPLFNYVTVIIHTVHALLPHIENTLEELKRKFQFDRQNQRVL
uniref:Uncharacterized protein n=1 Tax=viral metagenome TaxID=1070528 RepID=A0A6C0CRH5_9ZZZZ